TLERSGGTHSMVTFSCPGMVCSLLLLSGLEGDDSTALITSTHTHTHRHRVTLTLTLRHKHSHIHTHMFESYSLCSSVYSFCLLFSFSCQVFCLCPEAVLSALSEAVGAWQIQFCVCVCVCVRV